MNIPPEMLSALTLLGCALISGAFMYWSNKNTQKTIEARTPYQNDKDRADALKTMFELAGMDINEQLALKKEQADTKEKIKTLENTLDDIVTNTQIRVTTVQTVYLNGNNPRAEIISVESLRILNKHEAMD